MIIRMSDLMVGCTHDWYIFPQCGINDVFSVVLRYEGRLFYIYGDPATKIDDIWKLHFKGVI